MNETKQEAANIVRIRSTISEIQSISVGSNDRFPNKPEAIVIANRLQEFALSLQSCSISGASHKWLFDLGNWLEAVKEELLFVSKFPGVPYAEDQIATLMENRWDEGWNNYVVPTVVLSQVMSSETTIPMILASITLKRSEIEREIAITKKEMDEALSIVKQLYGQTVIAKHAGNFKQEADAQSCGSIAWAVAAVTAAVSLVVFANHQHLEYQAFLRNLPEGKNILPLIWEQAIFRLVSISMITYLVVICVRNFTAARHNLVVNRHRMNALSAFETFAKAAESPEAKTAVLLEATKAVFSPQPTGLLKQEGEPAHGGQIVEVFKSLSEHGK